MADETPNENPDNAAAEAAASDDQEPTLEEQLAAAIAERDTNLDRWHRAEAECENVRKRMRRELEEARRYESLGLSRDILPALDNLQRSSESWKRRRSRKRRVRGQR